MGFLIILAAVLLFSKLTGRKSESRDFFLGVLFFAGCVVLLALA